MSSTEGLETAFDKRTRVAVQFDEPMQVYQDDRNYFLGLDSRLILEPLFRTVYINGKKRSTQQVIEELGEPHRDLLTYYAVSVHPDLPVSRVENFLRLKSQGSNVHPESGGLEQRRDPIPKLIHVVKVAPQPDAESLCAKTNNYLKEARSINFCQGWRKAQALGIEAGAGISVVSIEIAKSDRVDWITDFVRSQVPDNRVPEGFAMLEAHPQIKSLDLKKAHNHTRNTALVLEGSNHDGIVPGAQVGIAVNLWYDAHGAPVFNNPSAIFNAVCNMAAGDILLIEQQGENHLFVEKDPCVWRAIKFATDRGIIVIEPAGNGGHNLDALPEQADSGAIIVGACAGESHGRWISQKEASNFGNRVHCFAYGRAELDDPDDPGDTITYTGTSAAAAQIAGVAALIQSLVCHQLGRPLLPGQMRDLLMHEGHPAQNPREPIGVMPNLPEIISKLGI